MSKPLDTDERRKTDTFTYRRLAYPADRAEPHRRMLHFVVLAYIATIPWDIMPVAFGRTASVPSAVLLIGTWIINRLRYPHFFRLPAGATIAIYAYVVWAATTVFWSPNADRAWLAFEALLAQVVVAFILATCIGPIWVRSLITLGGSAAVVSLIVLSNPANPARGGRANIAGANENFTALYLSLGYAALVFVIFQVSRRPQSLILMAPTLVVAAAVLHTGSRAGAVSIAVITIGGILQHIWISRTRPAVWAFAALVLVSTYLLYAAAVKAGIVSARVVALFGSSGEYSDSGRGEINALYFKTFDAWWVHGIGLGGDQAHLRETTGVSNVVHQLPLNVWVETGIIGLALFGTLVVLALRQGLRCASPGAMLLISVPIIVSANTTSILLTGALWFVIAFGLTSPGEEGNSVTEKLALNRTANQLRRPNRLRRVGSLQQLHRRQWKISDLTDSRPC